MIPNEKWRPETEFTNGERVVVDSNEGLLYTTIEGYSWCWPGFEPTNVFMRGIPNIETYKGYYYRVEGQGTSRWFPPEQIRLMTLAEYVETWRYRVATQTCPNGTMPTSEDRDCRECRQSHYISKFSDFELGEYVWIDKVGGGGGVLVGFRRALGGPVAMYVVERVFHPSEVAVSRLVKAHALDALAWGISHGW